ncbi:MAG: serine/threonine-protein kinase [Planctomycetota bacterium]|jgi:hypothetical protein|nr:serine/threonine-protein kinase [Planctomycetota bacterium]
MDSRDDLLLDDMVRTGQISVEDLGRLRRLQEQHPTRSLADHLVELGTLGNGESSEDRFSSRFRLGGGEGGDLYRVHDPQLYRSLVMKVFKEEEGDLYRKRQFIREAQITAQIEHPNIVPIHELVEVSGDTVYFTMKEVGGKTLSDLITREETSLPDFLRIFTKVCDAVAHAHASGVIHRDLKPQNIRVGEHGAVYVMNWGGARVTSSLPGESVPSIPATDPVFRGEGKDLSISGEVLGTLAYMSPEQLLGRREVDVRSDVYLLGGILYEILTGTPPHRPKGEGPSWFRSRRRAVRRRVEPARDRVDDRVIPRELEAVAIRALSPLPQERYPEVEALKREVEAYLDGLMVEAAVYSRTERLGRWMRRHRWVVGMFGFGVLLLVFWGGVHLLRGEYSKNHAFARAIAEAARIRKPLETDKSWQVVEGSDFSLEIPDDRETDREREQRIRQIEIALQVAESLDRALRIRPNNSGARRDRERVARFVGLLALRGKDYLLARQAFGQLEAVGVSLGEVKAWKRQIDQHQKLDAYRSMGRIREILDELRRGGASPVHEIEDTKILEWVLEVLSMRSREGVELLAEELEGLTRRARTEETGFGSKWGAVDRGRVKFLCQILGRIGDLECVESLGCWLLLVKDPELAVVAGVSLARTGREEAHSYLDKALRYWGTDSVVSRRIRGSAYLPKDFSRGE